MAALLFHAKATRYDAGDVSVDYINKIGVIRVKAHQWVGVLKVRLGWIQSYSERMSEKAKLVRRQSHKQHCACNAPQVGDQLTHVASDMGSKRMA